MRLRVSSISHSPNSRSLGLIVIGLTLIFAVLAAPSASFAQGIVTGSIAGTVQDPQGATVAGAHVQATNVATGETFSDKSNNQGYFEITNLPVGTYSVTIESAGFRKLQLSAVTVVAGRTNMLSGQTLAVGSASETVTVEAATPLIESQSSQIGGDFDTKVVQTLPNAGAGFDNLVLFIPGVANNGSTNFSNSNGAAIANNGLRGRSNNFQIDGQANNDNSVAGPLVFISNPDVMEELQVVTNNFSAEYGRDSGSVVNYITKSGTNQFHGSAFEFYEGDWDRSLANGQKSPLLGFCASGVATGTNGCRAAVVPRFVENRFGGTIGGPILKNRLWFFGSDQEDKQRAQNSSTSSSLTPTPAGITALDAAFPNNPAVATLKQFGPYAIKAGNPQPTSAPNCALVPRPAGCIDVSNGTTFVTVPFAFVNRVVGNNFDDRQIVGRGDWQISRKDRFFFRFIYQDSTTALNGSTSAIAAGAFVAVPAQDRQYGWDYTRTWTANLVQQVRVSYGKGFFQFAGGQGFPQCTIDNVTACPPNISFSDLTNPYLSYGLATNLPQDRQVHNTQYQSNISWTHGRHTFKWGGEFDHQSSPNHFLPSINGGFTFLSSPGAAADCVGSSGATACNAYSNFIKNASGCPAGATCSQLSLTQGPFNFNFKENDLAFYGQDDFRLTPSLTLNLGLRWEWDQQAINLLHDISVQNVANGFWAAGLPTSVTEIPHIPEDLNNFGPNVGVAWTPHIMKRLLGDGKTVFRGGYRVAYDPSYYNIFLNVATTAPVVNAGTLVNVGVPQNATGVTVQSAYLSQIPLGGNPGGRSQTRVSPDFHNPYVEQWSFGLERSITSRISVESRYVGNHGVGNFQTIDSNPQICTVTAGACTGGLEVQFPQAIPAGFTPCLTNSVSGSNTSLGRINCSFALVRTRTNGAWSIYNGVQNELKIRAFRGLTADVAYTFSKGLDNTSEIFSSTGGVSNPIPMDPFDPNVGERGVSAQSFPHVVTTYWVYELPWKQSQQGLLGKVIGGWELSGTHRYQSGVPITPVQNVQSTNNGDPYCDLAFNTNFIGSTLDSCRPILSNANAPFNTSGRYTSATNLINVTTGLPTTPNAVHFIVNNTFAINALCGGNPYACTVGRNVYRSDPRNQVDLSLQKAFKLYERMSLTLRGDAINAFNYQFYGVPGLNINNKNASGTPPSTFGEVWGNNGTFRSVYVSAHLTF